MKCVSCCTISHLLALLLLPTHFLLHSLTYNYLPPHLIVLLCKIHCVLAHFLIGSSISSAIAGQLLQCTAITSWNDPTLCIFLDSHLSDQKCRAININSYCFYLSKAFTLKESYACWFGPHVSASLRRSKKKNMEN